MLEVRGLDEIFARADLVRPYQDIKYNLEIGRNSYIVIFSKSYFVALIGQNWCTTSSGEMPRFGPPTAFRFK